MKKNINLPFLFISMMLAIIVWNVIMNIIDPMVSRKIVVPINMIYTQEAQDNDKSYSIDKSNQQTTIYYNVRTSDDNKLNANNFYCSVHIEDNTISSYQPIKIELKNEANKYVHNMHLEPDKVYVTTDDYMSKSFNISTIQVGRLISNDLLVGYISVNPQEVEVEGAMSEITNIDRVCIDVDLSGQSDTFDDSTVPKLYDKNGNELPSDNLTIKPNVVNYKAVIYTTKNVNINAIISGNVAKGHSYAGTIISPYTITVSGPKEVLDTITSIDLPELNITDASENQELLYGVNDILPKGVRNASSTSQIKVIVTINDMAKELNEEEEEEAEEISPEIPFHPANVVTNRNATSSSVIIHKPTTNDNTNIETIVETVAEAVESTALEPTSK